MRRGFGRNVPNADSPCAARKPAVSDERNFLSKPLTDNRACRGKHFRHARPSPWPFIPDDDNVAFLYFARKDCLHCLVFRVKTDCLAFKPLRALVDSACLDDCAFRSKVSEQDAQSAFFLVRVGNASDDSAVKNFGILYVFAERFSSNGG